MAWHIAHVRTGDELSLGRDLDHETYIPQCERKIRIRGKRSRRRVAAWPGYLLIRDPAHIEDSRFYRFLMEGEERASLTDDAVDGFRLMERLGAFQTHAESEVLLGIGESVKVAQGLLKGLSGKVQEVWGGKAQIGGGDFQKPVRVPLALLKPLNAST
jgi:transcription antitermination factor NusG